MKRKKAAQEQRKEQTLGEYLAAVKDIRDEQFKQEKSLSKEIQKATRDLKRKGLGITQESIVAQVYMQGQADRISKEALLRKAEEYCKKNQKQLAIQMLYVATVLNIILLFMRYIWGMVYLDRIIISNSPLYMALSIIIPIVTWIFMTTQEYYNFHNRKFLLLVLVVADVIATILQPLWTLVWDVLVVNIFKIPVNDAMTMNMILNLARIAEFAVMALGIALCSKIIYPFVFATEAKEKLMTFKLKHIVDLRKDKEYKYDFCCVKDLKTGTVIKVKEQDRTQHCLLVGASGTGKTSTIYTRQIVEDMKKKIQNREIQQKKVLQMVQQGHVRVKESFKSFGKEHFVCMPEKQQEFDDIFRRYGDCGITVIAPNNSMNEDILKFASARGIWVNNLDPSKKKPTHPYERLVGMNPFYLPPEYADIALGDVEAEEERTIAIAERANNFADALTAINEMAGTGDIYFTDVNTTVTSNISTVAMLDASIHGRQLTIGDVYNLINDFSLLDPIIKRLEEHFAMKLPDYKRQQERRNSPAAHRSLDELDDWKRAVREDEDKADTLFNELNDKVRENPYSKTLITVKARLTKGSKMDEHAEGLRNLLSKLLQDPRVSRVLVPKGEIIDFDEILKKNEITVVNTALQFGKNTSTCFGQLFILNFNTATLRRPKAERSLHFLYEDESARYLSDVMDTQMTLYRQYNVCCMFALQSLAQPEKSMQTAYLKKVLESAGTVIAFGRTSPEDSELISKMGGQERYEMVQKTEMRNSILSENPTSSTSERTTPDQMNVLDPQDVRIRDFQEMTIITTDEGRVVKARLAKGSFVPVEEFDEQPKMIERARKWMLVWRSKFPKKADIMQVDASTVIPPKGQDKVHAAVERMEKMSLHVHGRRDHGMGMQIEGKESLQSKLAIESVLEAYDEEDEFLGEYEEVLGFKDEGSGTEIIISTPAPVQPAEDVVKEKTDIENDVSRAEPEAAIPEVPAVQEDYDSIEEEYRRYQQRIQEEARKRGSLI